MPEITIFCKWSSVSKNSHDDQLILFWVPTKPAHLVIIAKICYFCKPVNELTEAGCSFAEATEVQ